MYIEIIVLSKEYFCSYIYNMIYNYTHGFGCW
jgi:hypothetical protein